MRTAFYTAALLLVSSQAFADEERRIDETRDLAKDGTLTIRNIAGSVRVTGHDQAKVVFRGRLGERVKDFEIRGSGSELSAEVIAGRHGDSSAELEIFAPRGARIEIRTVSADIRVKDLDGDLDLETTSGELRIDGAPKTLRLKSISGDIEARAKERIEIQSVSGDVHLSPAAKECDVRTVSGDIRIRGGTVARLKAKSVSGDVEFEAELVPDADLDVESHSGDIDLEVGSSASLQVSAETFSGQIGSDDESGGGFPGHSKKWKIGDGKGRARVRTFSGDVRVEP